MATSSVSNIATSTPQISTMRSSSLSESARKDETKASSTNVSSLNVSADVAKDSKPAQVDTVQISNQALQSSANVKKDEAKNDVKKDDAKTTVKKDETKKVDAKKESSGNGIDNAIPEGNPAKVQFVYSQKGNLITKYLNASGELVYQVPSKLMLLTKETESNSNPSVDTRV